MAGLFLHRRIEALCAALIVLIVALDVSGANGTAAAPALQEPPVPSEMTVPLSPAAGELVRLSDEAVLPLPAGTFSWGETRARTQRFDLVEPARVYAARPGVVLAATGQQLTVRHDDIVVRYGPLRSWSIPGDRLAAGSELGWSEGSSLTLRFDSVDELFDPRLWLVPPDLVVDEASLGLLVSAESTDVEPALVAAEAPVEELLGALADSGSELEQVSLQADGHRTLAETLRADAEAIEANAAQPGLRSEPYDDETSAPPSDADPEGAGDEPSDGAALQTTPPVSRVTQLVEGATPAVASELVRAVQAAADGLDATADTLVDRVRSGRRAVADAIGRAAGLDQADPTGAHADAAALMQRYLHRLADTGAPVLTRDDLLSGQLPDGAVPIAGGDGEDEAGVARWTAGSVVLLPQETIGAVTRAFALVGTELEHRDAWSCARLAGSAYPELFGLLPFEQAELTSVPDRLRMGDLVFYGTARTGVDDVALFIGQGLVIRTDDSGTVVVTELDGARVWGAGRLLEGVRQVPAVRPGTVEWRCGAPRTTAAPLTEASWGGHGNGSIPASQLCGLSFAPGHLLRCDATGALELLAERFEANFGYPMCMTDSYRPYASQVRVRAAKPHLAAVPGTSIHGWGLAVDLCRRNITSLGFRDAEYRWLWANAPSYGWVHPPWARANGSKPEPWHWEFGLFGQSWNTSAGRPPAPVASRIVDEQAPDQTDAEGAERADAERSALDDALDLFDRWTR
jgi:hypothetical protein